MADAKFSAAAATGCLIVVILTAVQSIWVPTALFAALTVGFVIRAADGYRKRK
jgi:hypothetical protein